MAEKYTVIDQRQTSELTPSGSFRDVFEVTFQDNYGHQGKVSIPKAGYSPEAVNAAILPLVDAMDAVKNL